MGRCPRCRGRGVYSDEGRIVCLLCGHVIRDAEPTLLEKLVSNATPESADGAVGPRVGRPMAPIDLEQVRARVLAAIRRES